MKHSYSSFKLAGSIFLAGIFFLANVFIITGCTSEDELPGKKGNILLLKIDYETRQFEGGIEQQVRVEPPAADTIPIRIDYKSPGDFGSIALYHRPGNERLLEGTIVWAGEGELEYPTSFTPPDDFQRSDTALPFPGVAAFQILQSEHLITEQIDLEGIWDAVSDLRLVSEYRKSGKKLSLLRYTPGVGAGDPVKWDWFLIMGQ